MVQNSGQPVNASQCSPRRSLTRAYASAIPPRLGEAKLRLDEGSISRRSCIEGGLQVGYTWRTHVTTSLPARLRHDLGLAAPNPVKVRERDTAEMLRVCP